MYLKNIHKSAKPRDVEEVMAQFGEVLSCKLAYSAQSIPLGYAYMQFEEKAGAEAAIAKGVVSIKEQEVSVSTISRVVKADGGNNLYLKNLPADMDLESL